MQVSLNPSSGYANSYFDVEFKISFDKHPKTTIKVFNETVQDSLEILGINQGYILNGKEAVVTDVSEVVGHINIFNRDKMNEVLGTFSSVKLKFEITQGTKIISENVIFYNEGKSLDSDVIPFDLVIKNKTIDISKNKPLEIDIISAGYMLKGRGLGNKVYEIEGLQYKRYELCIKPSNGMGQYDFEIFVKRGKNTIFIPSEIIYYDLDLKNQKNKNTYDIYFVKYEGITYSKVSNRRHVKINNTQLEFDLPDYSLTPQPQTRNNMFGNPYGSDFILSDRYLVLCHKDYSGFVPKVSFSREKMTDLVLMTYEGQSMRSVSKKVQVFGEDKSAKAHKTIHKERIQQSVPIGARVAPNQVKLFDAWKQVYKKFSGESIVTNKVSTFSVPPVVQQKTKKGGCLPCSRKRNKNV